MSHKKPDHVADDDARVEKSLQAIYQGPDGALPDFSVLEQAAPHHRWLSIMIALVGAAMVVLAIGGGVRWAVRPFQQPSQGFGLTIRGPSQAALGREETYEIVWNNETHEVIDHGEIRVGLPQDFVLTSATPAPADPTVRLWKIGRLELGGRGTIQVKGFFVGALGTQTAVQAIGTYRPVRGIRDVEASAVQSVTYSDTVLSGNILTPATIVSGDTVTIRYVVANLGKQMMSGLSARVQMPSGFLPGTVASSTRVDLSSREIWFPVGDLAPNTFFTAPVMGSFASGISGDLVFQGEAGRRSPEGAFLPAQHTESHVSVLGGDLIVHAVVNGSDADQTIQPGEPLRLTLAYQNTSPEVLKDVALEVGLESRVDGVSATGTTLIHWSDIEDSTGGVSTTKARVQIIRYDKRVVPAFAEFASQAEGTIELGLPTRSVASGTKDAVVIISVQGTVGKLRGTNAPRTVRARPMAVRYRTDADLTVEARYFTEEGAPVGSGPLPPVAGKTTAYRLTWRVSKTLHALSDVRVTAVLPKIGAWSNKTLVDSGSLTYDPATRTVQWTMPQMPEGVGALEASFEIQLTPQTIDIGRFAALLGETTFQARDISVSETLTRTKPSWTTDLQQDDGARGKGVVRKP